MLKGNFNMVDVLVQLENSLDFVTTSDIYASDIWTFWWKKEKVAIPYVIRFNPVGDKENTIYVFTKSLEEANNLIWLAYSTKNLDLRAYANTTITINEDLYDKEDFNEIRNMAEQLHKEA